MEKETIKHCCICQKVLDPKTQSWVIDTFPDNEYKKTSTACPECLPKWEEQLMKEIESFEAS